MSQSKTLLALKTIAELLEARGYSPVRLSSDIREPLFFTRNKSEVLNHALWLTRETQKFIDDKPNKANRWLGFAQACLWFCDGYSIAELKAMNR